MTNIVLYSIFRKIIVFDRIELVVGQTVTIANVDDKGRVGINGPWYDSIISIYDFCVVVTGVPTDIAISLNGGDKVYLEATINGIIGDYNYFYNCETTLQLTYKKIE